MLMLLVATILVVIVSVVRLFSMKRKLDALSQSHWALRYEFARLRARVAKLDADGSGAAADQAEAATSDEHA